MNGLIQDLRYGLRQLRNNRGFAVTAIITLSLGIGTSAAIFALVDAALIKPLPYKQPSRLASLYESIPLGPRFHLSYPDYLDWKTMNIMTRKISVPHSLCVSTRSSLSLSVSPGGADSCVTACWISATRA